MAYINWVTAKGNIGTFPSSTALSFEFKAVSTISGMTLTYQLLNGQLPTSTSGIPLTLGSDGYLIGTPANIPIQTTYSFTIRVTDSFGNLSDRTFSMDVYSTQNIKITTPSGELVYILDSTYIDYQIAVENLISTNNYYMSISSGALPTGVTITPQGRINGYAAPPYTVTGEPTSKSYNFTVQAQSDLGTATKQFYITIINQNIDNPPNTRPPTILNNKPLRLPLNINDPYYSYYLDDSNYIPTIQANEYFSFKILGHAFDNQQINYIYSTLPDGLYGDPITGWITGSPVLTDNSINQYNFDVTVVKASNPGIMSTTETYSLVITNNITQDVVWSTDSDLGMIFNGSISELYVEATSAHSLSYRVVSGSLPPNLTLLPNGQITGIVPFQANKYGLMAETNELAFTFTISAYNPQYPIVSNQREFTVTVYQKYAKPVENIYFKASPNIQGRQIIQSLLTDETLIPTDDLYRPEDSNFGKATSVKYVHTYGIESANIQTYLAAIDNNHYYRKIILGELKTAIARNSNGDVIYEVVYADIVDPLVRPDGVTLPQSIVWPVKISLDLGPWFVDSNQLYTSSDAVFTSYDFGTVRTLYPASITNMRTELIARMNYNNNQSLLPAWMTSQQSNGGTLGFTNGWVICYTLPGKSETIKNNINNNWPYKLNIIDFSIDRFVVDKRATYNFNTNLVVPTWTELPSNTPTPDPSDTYDLPVLFQQKTILPKNIDY